VHDAQTDIGPSELRLEIERAIGRGEKFAGRRRLCNRQRDADHVEPRGGFVEVVVVLGFKRGVSLIYPFYMNSAIFSLPEFSKLSIT